MLRKLIYGLLAGVLFAGAVALVFFYLEDQANADVERRVARYERRVAAALDAALARQDSAAAALSERFESIDDLKTAQERRLRVYRNADQLQTARRLGVGRVAGRDDLDRLVQQGRLVRLRDNAYYRIQKLDYSVPYVTPDAARLLDRIGERFHERLRAEDLPLYRFVISSVLRTGENQQALRRINPNATAGVSTHEFGTTLDVVYHTYEYLPRPEDALAPTRFSFLTPRLEQVRKRTYEALGMRYWQELQGVLGRVLIDLQNDGAVQVTLEREQPVFHFTVAAPLAD